MTALARALALAACALTAPAAAQGLPDRAAAFVALVQDNGCALTEAEALTLLPRAGLTMDDAREAAALLHRGRLFTVDADGQTLRLVPELCTADAAGVAARLAAAAEAPEPGVQALDLAERVDPAEAARLAQIVRDNACALTEAQAEVQLPPLGYDREQVQDIVAVLFDGWMAEVDGDTLRLTPEACASDPATDAAWIAARLAQGALIEGRGGDPADPAALRAVLVMATAAGGCVLDPADAAPAVDLAIGIFRMSEAPEAERAALAARLAALAADPGPAFHPDPALPAGHLRLAYCPS